MLPPRYPRSGDIGLTFKNFLVMARKQFIAKFVDRKGKVLDSFKTNTYSKINDTFKIGQFKYIIESHKWETIDINSIDTFLYRCRMLTENKDLRICKK